MIHYFVLLILVEGICFRGNLSILKQFTETLLAFLTGLNNDIIYLDVKEKF